MKLLLLAWLIAAAPASAADPDSVRVAPVDFHSPLPAPGLQYSFGDYMLRDRAGSPGAGYLTVTLRDMHWYEPPTRFDAILGGAGAATSLGMFLGAVGTTLGGSAKTRRGRLPGPWRRPVRSTRASATRRSRGSTSTGAKIR